MFEINSAWIHLLMLVRVCAGHGQVALRAALDWGHLNPNGIAAATGGK